MQYYQVREKVQNYLNKHPQYTFNEVFDNVQETEDKNLAKELSFYVALALNDIKSQIKPIPKSELYL